MSPLSQSWPARFALPVIALAAVLCTACSRDTAASQRGDATIPVVTAQVALREMPLKLHVVGTVESTGSVTLLSRVDGQITQVFVRDGQEVKAGQKLLQIDPVPFELQVRMAQATLKRDEALLANARARADHGAELLKAHYISPDANTQLQTDLDTAQATVDQDRAALDNARLQLSYATISAPIAGKIGHIAQQVGNTIRASNETPITTLNALDTVDVTFALPEQQLAPVREAVATKKALQVTAAPVGADAHSLAGELAFIDNAADPTTGTIRLRARFDNRTRALWPGQLVDVTFSLPADGASLVIPDTAVGENSQGHYVYVVRGDGTAEQRAIKLLRTSDDFAIVSGVKEGETVVIDGQSRLHPDAKVRIEPARQPA
ncbi:MAG TPA: efflux RND transporter periplasmic adaptor subunit [Povalibacter sp.]|jgi:multidrug efflux system membrane fusion protein|nr:efflux RND transporter periplasmic adaptor subunit [Povalibacter sp.]